MKQPITDEDWKCRSEDPETKAHVLRTGWPRALCGLQVLNGGPWLHEPARSKCGACQRRLENSHLWLHVLGILR